MTKSELIERIVADAYGAQTLVRVRRAKDGRLTREALGACRFVDLIGEHGFRA